MQWVLLLNTLFFLSTPTATTAQDILQQVLVITRHGSRYPLTKAGDNLAESSTGRLTALGQRQMYDLGTWLRNNYNSSGVDLSIFDPDRVRLESSQYERTVTSANSLALGLFPARARDATSESLLPVTPANVPVYTYDRDNDIWLRAYDKCPTLHDNLQTLYQSDAWTQRENEKRVFLAQLAESAVFHPYSNPEGIVPLSEIWNVYDEISVAKTECQGQGTSPTCQSLPNPQVRDMLTDIEWIELQNLAHEAELRKYHSAGPLVGMNLLLEVARRMPTDDYRFSLFSAHYPTLLGIFAALDQVFFAEQVIPNYGAALIFEVTQNANTQERFFKLVYKGDDRPTSNPVVVNLDRVCGNAQICPVSALLQYVGDWTVEKWCRECANDNANVCLQLLLSQQSSSANDNNDNNNSEDHKLKHPLESGFLIGIAVGVLGMCLTVFVLRKYHNQQDDTKEESFTPTPPEAATDATTRPESTGHQPASTEDGSLRLVL